MNLVTLQGWLDNSAFAILFITLLVYWAGIAFPRLSILPTVGTLGMATANLTIAALLVARWIEGGYFPLSNLYESLFFVAWGITAVHLIAERMSQSPLVGAATAPVAMGIVAFAALSLPATMQVSEPLVPALKSNWLMMHVSVMLISYAALMVGALMAIAFLVVTRGQAVELRGSSVGTGGFRDTKLRRHGSDVQPASASLASEVSSVAASPSGSSTAVLAKVTVPAAVVTAADKLTPQRLTLADTLDNISYRIIGLGFPLLTIGIISGAVWANEAWGSYWSWDPKETWALITWLVFAAYLHARIAGRRPCQPFVIR
ncbi:MAG: c-type cytochrome biogenesis protein CcsB, partial [Cyanobacteria bacterium J06559_3]